MRRNRNPVAGLSGLVLGVSMTGQLLAQPNDTFYDQQTGLQKIQPQEAWIKAKGKGVLVAVLDSGIQFDHSDLFANLVPGRDLVAATNNDVAATDYDNFGVEIKNGTTDPNGHGTHVAGILGAIMDNEIGIAGVAPEVKILPVRVLDGGKATVNPKYENGQYIRENGNPILSSVAGLRYAVHWVGKHGAAQGLGENTNLVINTSFGSISNQNYCQAIKELVQQKSNFVIVAAAMNAGSSEERFPAACAMDSDADIADRVISVGNVRNSGERYPSSNFGPWVNVSAPGVHVPSTWNGQAQVNGRNFEFVQGNPDYAYDSGTSMSAAMVSGAAALLWSSCEAYTPKQIKDTLLANVDQFANASVTGMGSGIINVKKVFENLPHCPVPPIAPASAPARPTNFSIQ